MVTFAFQDNEHTLWAISIYVDLFLRFGLIMYILIFHSIICIRIWCYNVSIKDHKYVFQLHKMIIECSYILKPNPKSSSHLSYILLLKISIFVKKSICPYILTTDTAHSIYFLILSCVNNSIIHVKCLYDIAVDILISLLLRIAFSVLPIALSSNVKK